jgi:predicted dehydrogenase
MKKVNVGILGYGFVESNFHMPSYREISNVDVVAVGGRRKEAAKEFASAWRIKKTYSGEDFMEELCTDPKIDVVDIGLPNFLHEKAAALAVENGKHVICEKPLGRNTSEAKNMLDTARRARIIHCYAENHIFIPHISKAKKMIDEGVIGNPFWIRSREAHSGPHSAWFRNPDLAGGGVLIDMGCHSAATALHLFGKKPKEAFAWGATLAHAGEAEDNTLALLRHAGNELSQLENSWTAHGGIDIRLEIYGSEGTIFVDPARQTGVRVFTVAPEDKVGYIAEKAEAKKGWIYPTCREHETFGYLFELQHFLSCIIKSKKPISTFEDGYTVNCVIDSCYKSTRSKEWESVP